MVVKAAMRRLKGVNKMQEIEVLATQLLNLLHNQRKVDSALATKLFYLIQANTPPLTYARNDAEGVISMSKSIEKYNGGIVDEAEVVNVGRLLKYILKNVREVTARR